MTIKISGAQNTFEEINIGENYNGIVDRYLLMRFHPRKIVFDIVGVIWAAYFLWNQNWQAALTVEVVLGGLGLFYTRNIDPELMSQTTLGKIALLHKHPINLTLNFIGVVVLIYGLWMHSTEMILISLSIVAMGHFFGWANVNSKLRMI